MIICEYNTVFAKSDFWSKIRQPTPVSPIWPMWNIVLCCRPLPPLVPFRLKPGSYEIAIAYLFLNYIHETSQTNHPGPSHLETNTSEAKMEISKTNIHASSKPQIVNKTLL